MPLVLWTFLLVQAAAFAQPLGVSGCGVYSFQGMPKLESEKIILVLNEKTLSELRIDIPKSDEQDFAPYINIMTKGLVEISSFKDFKIVTAKKFSNLDYGTPNPLNPTKHSFISLKERQKCR